jgi:hypothetical protein
MSELSSTAGPSSPVTAPNKAAPRSLEFGVYKGLSFSDSDSPDQEDDAPLETFGSPPEAYRYLRKQHNKFIDWWANTPWVITRLVTNENLDIEKQIN